MIIGILIALKMDNWNQKRQEFKSQIENLENFLLTANEHMNLSHLNTLVEDALTGEMLWLDFLEEKIPWNDSLMMYGYLFGVIDGENWIRDPANPDSVFVPEIPTYNSVLTIEG